MSMPPPGSSRNLGKNYALAWNTGGGTHMTLVYLTNVKRGYEQNRVKTLVEDYLDANEVPEQLLLRVGDMTTKRCVSVCNPEIAALQVALHDFLRERGFEMRPLRPPHIDLRGQSDVILDETVGTRNWNW
ncbi:expressed unknown protein [Seminavis robusta]|uniref:Uncharacterized protein n=1 Tax=Seminavis robusta TaxID=568900 RepID=A0A9N8HS43_9STRA|nr:expressed unknown protein [Seminavis robusta]|eukprot:Sro1394_g268910.1 n/a (130) ;mRNA; f:8165-8554